MFVKRISLSSFRNFNELVAEFANHLICIKGDNAEGKTNLIESIYYLSVSKSFKKAEDKELIEFNKNSSSLGLIYNSEIDGEHIIKIDILQKGKIVYFDDIKQKSVATIVGKLPTVVYDPSSPMLFKQDPASRRKIIDETLSNLSQNYLYNLTRYRKLMKERNMALIQKYDEDVINVLTSELSKLDYKIYIERKNFVSKLNKEINSIYHELFKQEDKLTLQYISNVPHIEDENKFDESILENFGKIRTIERIKAVTLIGIHRDDLIASINDQSVGSFASQGQNRITTLALKLAIGKIYEDNFKEKPVYLLDDVLSDLDEERQKLLISYFKKIGQVFVTTAGAINEEDFDSIYEIKNKEIRRRK